MFKKNVFYFFFTITIFFIDRLSKYWAIKNLNNEDQFQIILSPYLSLDLIWNEGIAFGLLSFGERNLYNILTGLIILVTIIVIYLAIKAKGIEKYSFMMICGGSIGNIFDRLFYQAVPDFIDIHYENFHWFIFNVADIFITLGVFLLIFREFGLKIKN
ncbi:signal peptidase II [Candidatus Pelagibacter bacterium]|nr:signal peptidase II [Candidatus Pelagibacter bacterium]